MMASDNPSNREDLDGLDSSMFVKHPDGYTCRCGLPQYCVCPSDFPKWVIADLAQRVRELEGAIRNHERNVHPADVSGPDRVLYRALDADDR